MRTVTLALLFACNATPDEPTPLPDPVDAPDAWHPSSGTSWQWQLTGTVDTTVDVEMYDIDLFDVPDATLTALEDRVVVCYFSAGTVEDWRADAGDFPADTIGAALPEWDGERWLDVRDDRVRAVIEARLDRAVARGCDGVEPDNVDGYDNRNGLGLSEDDQRQFLAWLANAAHTRGLSVGLKNATALIPEMVGRFDWALNEECADFSECDVYGPFVAADKAVFHVEYVRDFADAPAKAAEVCGIAGFSTLVKEWDLGPQSIACE